MNNNKYNQKINSKILVIGSSPFGKNTFEFLRTFGANVDFFETTYKHNYLKVLKLFTFVIKILKVDSIYSIGYFLPQSPFYLIPRFLKKKIIIHWIGSEVLNLKKSHYWSIQGSFSVSKSLLFELSKNRIESFWLPLFFPLKYINELNQNDYINEHAVLFYLVDNKEEFYGVKYLLQLAKKFETIIFYVIGSSSMVFPYKNIINKGFICDNQLHELFKKITIYVRITEHDGLSQLILRSLSFGITVISNTDHPFVINFDPTANCNDDLLYMMRQILGSKPRINQDSINYMNEFYNHSTQFDRYFNAFKNIRIHL